MPVNNPIPYSKAAYIRAVLSALNLAATAARVSFLEAWCAKENTNAQFNPFATTWNKEPERSDKYIGGYYFNHNNGNPVKNYSNFQNGVEAFINTIKLPYYKGILAGLMSGKPFEKWYNSAIQKELNTYGGGNYVLPYKFNTDNKTLYTGAILAAIAGLLLSASRKAASR